jgi:hypothetical protein
MFRPTIRLRAGLTALGAAILASLTLAGLAAADPVFPTGMRIGLEPPPGLTVSKRFPGFEDADRKVTITLADLPGPAYAGLEKSIYAAPPPGLTVDSREAFAFKGGSGILAAGHSVADGVAVHKWLLIAKATDSKTGEAAALVVVQVPDAARTAYPDKAIRAALASVTFRPTPFDELVKRLPFKMGELAGFRVARVGPAGVILTEGPSGNLNTLPYVIIEVGRGSPEQTDARARFARDLLVRSPVPDLKIVSGEAMRITGVPGFEIKAESKAPDGTPVSVVQWVRFGTAGFVRMIGVARTGEWDKTFTRFRAMRDGLDFR